MNHCKQSRATCRDSFKKCYPSEVGAINTSMESWHEDVVVWGRDVGWVGYEAGSWYILTPFEEAAVVYLQQACKVKQWRHARGNSRASDSETPGECAIFHAVHADTSDADSTACSAVNFCIR